MWWKVISVVVPSYTAIKRWLSTTLLKHQPDELSNSTQDKTYHPSPAVFHKNFLLFQMQTPDNYEHCISRAATTRSKVLPPDLPPLCTTIISGRPKDHCTLTHLKFISPIQSHGASLPNVQSHLGSPSASLFPILFNFHDRIILSTVPHTCILTAS